MRKIFVLFMVINLALCSSFIFMQEAHAAVGKVVSQAAKHTAKEFTKDIAMDISFKLAMDAKYNMSGQKPKQGYEAICLPQYKKPTGECTNPLQIKKDVKREELSETIEKVLDKKIAGGASAAKWMKFLDWFAPIFAVGLGVAVIDYAIDGDVMSFFDEVAYEALVELGFIEPLGNQESLLETGNGQGFVRPSISLPELPLDAEKESWKVFQLDQAVNINGLFNCGGVNDCVKIEGVYSTKSKDRTLRIVPRYGGKLKATTANMEHYSDDFGVGIEMTQITLYQYATTKYGLDKNRLVSYRINPTLDTTPKYYIEALTGSTGNQTLLRPELYTFAAMNLLRFALNPEKEDQSPLLFTYIPGPVTKPEEVVVPKFDEAQLQPSKKPGTKVPVVAPGAYPLEEVGTGTPVYPSIDKDGNIAYRTADGRVVLDINVTVKNPTITVNSDGSLKVEKAPTPENPNPEPGEIPGKNKPNTESDLKCEKGFEKIQFGKVGHAFTNAFPFSIPWDLKRFIDNAFNGVGSEKPSFNLTFLGDDVVLEIPEYFNPWIKFFKGLIVILFDISLAFLFYRFMKGGGD
ncbi:hypothetical protein LSPCS325_53750 [Lysinibacillus sp. CTST325]